MIPPGIARVIASVLTFTLLGIPVVAQEPATPAPVRTPAPPKEARVPESLHIIVLEGQQAVNSISLGKSVTPIVEIRDSNEFPVEGASVTFTLPETGAGGVFPGKLSTYTNRSSAQGQVAAPYIVNGIPGKFEIKVRATSLGRTGETVISQRNAEGAYVGREIPPKPIYKKWQFWAIIGGAAAAGLTTWLVLRDTSNSTGPITITPGGPVFGPR